MSKMLSTFCAILLAGCATICSRSTYCIFVDCNEPGTNVEVLLGDKIVETLTTPATVELSSGDGYFWPASYRFEFSNDGFSHDSQKITASLDLWYLGNVIFGGLLGAAIIDPLTGAMWKFDGDTVVQGHVNRAIDCSEKMQ